MILEGRAIADDLYKELAQERKRIARNVKLGIVVVGENPVVESFVRIKERAAACLDVDMIRLNLSTDVAQEAIIGAVQDISQRTDGVIVQLPLPKGIDTDAVLASIVPEKDVDALNPTISESKRLVHAPVALAVLELLRRGGVSLKGKRTVVVGTGRLVGAPSAWLLKNLGADISIFSLEKGSIEDLKDADIVVLGAGNPGFIKPEHLKEGVALIDAGTSELNKKITGDADSACAEKASVFTPVPGGVGPVAVAMIFRNLFDLVEKRG